MKSGVAFCLALLITSSAFAESKRGVFQLAGEPVKFDSNLSPRFSEHQIAQTKVATRNGLVRWAATEQGRRLIAWFGVNEYEIVVREDMDEEGIGRAPQPGIATLVAAANHKRVKSYELILNPSFFKVPDGMKPLPGQPVTPSDMMAIAWAGEMIHIWFYARGISLPHHHRQDFQSEWRTVAEELRMPMVTHDDDDERLRYPSRLVRTLY